MNFYLRNRGSRVVFLENIFEDAADCGERSGESVNGDRGSLVIVEGADVIEAEDMIGVAVGIDDSIEPGNLGAEDLSTEIRRGIHHDVVPFRREQDRRPKALVARVRRKTDGAGTAYSRNAG